MRWEDERYIRVYTRDTPDWVALGWEAQALLVLLMRKCDRAGVLDMGRSGTRGLAAMLSMPVEVVDRALGILVEDGCAEQTGSKVVIRNFVEAQEAVASDAKRSRERRERARDLAMGVDTNRDEPSRNVTSETRIVAPVTRVDTDRHASSRGVTPNRTVPSRAEPNQPEDHPPTVGGRTRGTRLPEDWQPTAKIIARFRDEEHVDALASVERFKNHWLAKARKDAIKVDWDRAFINWVLEDIDRGKAKPLATTGPAQPPVASPDALGPEEAKTHLDLLSKELESAAQLPIPITRGVAR